jgi:hypothetical protein
MSVSAQCLASADEHGHSSGDDDSYSVGRSQVRRLKIYAHLSRKGNSSGPTPLNKCLISKVMRSGAPKRKLRSRFIYRIALPCPLHPTHGFIQQVSGGYLMYSRYNRFLVSTAAIAIATALGGPHGPPIST